jgi:hypothetical protein
MVFQIAAKPLVSNCAASRWYLVARPNRDRGRILAVVTACAKSERMTGGPAFLSLAVCRTWDDSAATVGERPKRVAKVFLN